jgi:tRNA-specific 2-thiouridylase
VRNVLTVVQGSDHPLLHADGLRTEAPHWISPSSHGRALRCGVKTRYRQADQGCTVEFDGNGTRVTFDTPQRAVTPGQSAVFYAGEECLGGAVISHALALRALRATASALTRAMPI